MFSTEEVAVRDWQVAEAGKISMRMCLGCELPNSVKNLGNLKLDCDEETLLLWERLKPEMRMFKEMRLFKIMMGI